MSYFFRIFDLARQINWAKIIGPKGRGPDEATSDPHGCHAIHHGMQIGDGSVRHRNPGLGRAERGRGPDQWQSDTVMNLWRLSISVTECAGAKLWRAVHDRFLIRHEGQGLTVLYTVVTVYICHGGPLHQLHGPSDDVWVVYLRPSGP